MANIVLNTENWNIGTWTQSPTGVVSANWLDPPPFALTTGTPADKLSDSSASTQDNVFSDYQTIPNDASNWVTSLYFRKDVDQTRFPEVIVQFAGGTGILCGVSINTQTGALASSASGSLPDAYGILDIDSAWWRVWIWQANNASGNTTLRMGIYPARSATLGGAASNTPMGLLYVWGANQTNTPSVAAYEPDPPYEIDADPRPRIMTSFLS